MKNMRAPGRRTYRAAARPARGVSALCAALSMAAALVVTACAALSPSEAIAGRESIVEQRGETPTIRVRLENDAEMIRLEGPSRYRVRAGRSAQSARLEGPLEIELTGDRWAVRDGRGSRRWFDRADTLEVISLDGSPIAIKDVRLSGTLHMVKSGDGSFDVVEDVDLERYVAGVISKELYPGWSRSAFEAQAIAARSYALHERQRRRARGDHFDVVSTVQDQAYGGLSDNATALDATRATHGMTLTFGGHLLRAYYSSTCGGRAASARDTWPTSRGFEFNLARPLQGMERAFECEGSPRFRWRVERPAARLARRIAAWGAANGSLVRKLDSIRSIEPSAYNATGRPSKHRITDGEGKWYELSAEELRLAMNFTDGGQLWPLASGERVLSGDIDVAVRGATAEITGRGFGHGVGMCQFCAEGFSKRGESATMMLSRFYPGAEVRRLY